MEGKIMKKIFCVLLCVVVLATMSFPSVSLAKDMYSNSNSQHGSVHDPSIIKNKNGEYYIFGSHISSAKSKDLINWTNSQTSIDTEFTNLLSVNGASWKDNLSEPLEWTTACQEYMNYPADKIEFNCWAADVIYNETMGKYCMYACCSVWGTCYSVIFLATADNIDGPYIYDDSFIYSGFRNDNAAIGYKHTNIKN